MNHKQLTLTTLCFLIQLCFISGFPTPEDPPKADAAKADAPKADAPKADATAEASSDASKPATPATDEASKATTPEASASASTDTPAASDLLAALQLTPEKLAAIKDAVNTSPASQTTASGFNPLSNIPNVFGMFQPMADMFREVIDGTTNIYLNNRPNAVKFAQMATDPFLPIARLLLTPFGSDTADKLRSLGIKAVMDNSDNLVQGGNLLAHTVPTAMSTVARTGSGLLNMQALKF